MSNFVLGDCLEAMREMPDKAYQLAIVDPPYGGGAQLMQEIASAANVDASAGGSTATSRTIRGGADSMPTASVKCGRTGGTWATKYQTNGGIFDHDIRHWDIAPTPEYFHELRRVSENQVIWGGNYFRLPENRCFLVWRKTNIPLKGFTMAPCEYAWTSFNANAAMFEFSSSGTPDNPRFHPTQKPIELYEWVLGLFASEGDRILDTHAGSGSLEIACERLGYEYTAYEINETYYRLATERLERERMQGRLF